MTKEEKVKKLKKEVENLKVSPLYEYRIKNSYKPVIGRGSLNADIMFIGEAPGKNEAKTGKPFVGAAGKVLDTLLKNEDLDRTKVCISNIVMDRPPGNRDPHPTEIRLYSPFVFKLIEIINPKIIATLGRISMREIFIHYGLEERLDTIGKIHGRVFEAKNADIKIVPLYHPAAALYNRGLLQLMKADFENFKLPSN